MLDFFLSSPLLGKLLKFLIFRELLQHNLSKFLLRLPFGLLFSHFFFPKVLLSLHQLDFGSKNNESTLFTFIFSLSPPDIFSFH
jgi:hypothetical protein